MTESPLAPEALAGVRRAQSALEDEANRLEAVDDPAAPMIRAMALTMQAISRLMVDASLSIEHARSEIEQAINLARVPLTPRDIDAVTKSMDLRLLRRWTVLNRLAIAVAVCIGMFGAVGAGYAGWWLRGEPPIGVWERAGADQCSSQPDGGRLCWMPILTHPSR